jgi:uncharacterized membrane protein
MFKSTSETFFSVLVVVTILLMAYLAIFGYRINAASAIELILAGIMTLAPIILFLWMAFDCFKRNDLESKWVWAILFVIGTYITSIFYYVLVYRRASA